MIKSFRDFLAETSQKDDKVVRPETIDDLKQIIRKTMRKEGNSCNLNFIDTSLITDMSYLFAKSPLNFPILHKFNGDISKWDTSKVKSMSCMFSGSLFNGDISKWDTSKVKSMRAMFDNSKFNGDISKWDTSKVEDMYAMFRRSIFTGDISRWNVSKVKDMSSMFEESIFKGDLSKWDTSKVKNSDMMFFKARFCGVVGDFGEITGGWSWKD